MKIIQTIGWIAPRYGGPAVLVPQMARALALRGHEVVLITTNVDGAGELPPEEIPSREEAGYTTLACPRSWPRWYLASRAMSAALDEHVRNADVLHVHMLYRYHALASRRACIRHGVPLVLSPHGALDSYQRQQHRLRKLVYHRLVEDGNIRAASVIQYNSEQERAEVDEMGFGIRGVVIPNGLDAAEFQTPAGANLLPEGIQADQGPLIVSIGRLAEKKGLPRLISALAIVRETVPDARLAIAGPDDYGLEDGLRSLARELGVADAVAFPGPVYGRAKVALLQHARVFGLPSDDENFGMVVAEAMAAGVPSVISDRVALHSIVSGHDAGSVVSRDPADVAAGLLPYLQDARMARARGANAAAAARELFSWDHVAGLLEEMYASVCRVRGAQQA